MSDPSTTESASPRWRISGTTAMIGGTAVSAASVYGYQVIAGRTLGTEGFAPIGVIWTILFLVYTVLMIPVEQFITRKLTLTGGPAPRDSRTISLIGTTAVIGVTLGVGFGLAFQDRFFDGDVSMVVVLFFILTNRSVMAIGRGFLAGRRRFYGYGASVAAEGVVLVVGAAFVAVVNPSIVAFAVVLAVAPLTVLLLRPFTRVAGLETLPDTVAHGAAFLGWLIMATAAAQVILAGGPIVVGFVGGTAGAISVFFITFTLFRGPVTSSYNVVARVLPDFTTLAAQGEQHRLSAWAGRLGLIGIGLTVVFGLSGYLLGPFVIEVLYGSEFVPSSTLAGLGAAGVGAALTALFINQIYVARGETGRLSVIWLVALVAAGTSLIVFQPEPVIRVGIAFVVGEVTAMGLLAIVGTAAHWAER